MDSLGTPPSSLGPLRLWLCLSGLHPAGCTLQLGFFSCPDAYTIPRGACPSSDPFVKRPLDNTTQKSKLSCWYWGGGRGPR